MSDHGGTRSPTSDPTEDALTTKNSGASNPLSVLLPIFSHRFFGDPQLLYCLDGLMDVLTNITPQKNRLLHTWCHNRHIMNSVYLFLCLCVH